MPMLPGGGDFAEAAVIHEWKETGHKVQIYTGGKCAVVTYFFSITFAMGHRSRPCRAGTCFSW